jgi:hypothetical protein
MVMHRSRKFGSPEKSTGPVLENLYRQLGSVDLVAIVLKKIVVARPAPTYEVAQRDKIPVYVIHFLDTAFIDTETYRVYCVV